MTNSKHLCLNMIVKNEITNLKRCLDAVAARNVSGEMHEFPFHNFEQARNERRSVKALA